MRHDLLLPRIEGRNRSFAGQLGAESLTLWNVAPLVNVLRGMFTQMADTGSHLRELRAAYEAAFMRWASKVNLFHLLAQASSDGELLMSARKQMDEAERDYHASRDLLAEFMMKPHRDQGNGARHSYDVEHLAYFLWEGAGRPHGTAESDWYRAERLISPHVQY
jgi:hypothetical protein